MNGTAEQYERQALEALAKAERWDNTEVPEGNAYRHWAEQERRNALVYATLAQSAAVVALAAKLPGLDQYGMPLVGPRDEDGAPYVHLNEGGR